MDLLAGLDDAQRQAVVSPAAPLCIVAAPGSGKTRVLTHRIAHRVATGSADAAHVLALTFTRKAAGELRSRLGGLGVDGSVAAGTFHAVAYAQLRRWWADTGRQPPVLLERKARLLTSIVRLAPGESIGAYAVEIEWAKARLLTPERYPAAALAAGRRPPQGAEQVAAVLERYEEEKRRRGLADFDDLLAGCADLLERDAEQAAAARWRFRHLFVDEYQDVNPAQFRLLRAWLGDRTDLCVVGDPNQAIYGWNGADPRLLTGFRASFPTAEVVHLVTNYRSTPEIVGAGAAVLATGTVGAVDARSVRPPGRRPVVREHATADDETAAVARSVRDAHRPGVPWRHIAVLARTNAQLVPLSDALAAAGIPHRSPVASIADHPAVRQALDVIRGAPPGMPFLSRLADVGALIDEADDDDHRAALTELVRLAHEYHALDQRAPAAGFRPWLTATLRRDGGHPAADAVELTTFHRAKGLEWPVVFLVGLEEGFVPIAGAGPGGEDEERRLLHVAVTRAVDELHCSWARSRRFGERTVERRPSRWLDLVAPPVPSDAAAIRASADARRRALHESRALLARNAS